jgi:hypothetical protein
MAWLYRLGLGVAEAFLKFSALLNKNKGARRASGTVSARGYLILMRTQGD